MDNPYAGAKGYVNPEWKAKADAEPGGSRVSNNPTAVWLDRIAAIDGTPDSSSNGAMGVRDHLDAALSQGAGTYIQFVIYNLPGRDCSALASNGELGPNELPGTRPSTSTRSPRSRPTPKYASLRIVNIIEIDSLPNLVTNTSGNPAATAMCDTMKANGGYVNGVGYALTKLGAIAQRLQLHRRRATTAGSAGTATSARPPSMLKAAPPSPPAAPSTTCTASSPTPPTTRRCASRTSRSPTT